MGFFKELVAEYMDYFRATFARCMFLMHALIVIWRTVILLGDTFWLLAIGVLFIISEYCITVFKRRGQEWRWVSPATMCYLVSAVPGLWLQKLYHLGHYGSGTSSGIATVPSTELTLDFSSEDWMLLSEQTMMVTIILSRWLLPKDKMTHNEVSQLLLLYLSLSSDIIDFLSIFGYTKVTSDEAYCYVLLFWWTWALLQFTLVLTSTNDDDSKENEDTATTTITTTSNNNNNSNNNKDDSRLPRDDINEADCESPRLLTGGVSASQITLDTKSDGVVNNQNCPSDAPSSGPHRLRREKRQTSTGDELHLQDEPGDDSSSRRQNDDEESGEVRETGNEKGAGESGKETEVKWEGALSKSVMLKQLLCSSEMWAILVVFFLQDGPFLVNRLVVMLYFNVFNYTIIFFICKNMLVLCLQTYRVIALCLESRAKLREARAKVKEERLDKMKTRRFSVMSLHSVCSLDVVGENSEDEVDHADVADNASKDQYDAGDWKSLIAPPLWDKRLPPLGSNADDEPRVSHVEPLPPLPEGVADQQPEFKLKPLKEVVRPELSYIRGHDPHRNVLLKKDLELPYLAPASSESSRASLFSAMSNTDGPLLMCSVSSVPKEQADSKKATTPMTLVHGQRLRKTSTSSETATDIHPDHPSSTFTPKPSLTLRKSLISPYNTHVQISRPLMSSVRKSSDSTLSSKSTLGNKNLKEMRKYSSEQNFADSRGPNLG